MDIELLTIGDELLNGVITDTNSSWLCQRLFELGFEVNRCTTLPDEIEILIPAIQAIASRSELCIITGGLGPTQDDLTVDALAGAAEVSLEYDEGVWAQILKVYGRREPPKENRRQARIPVGGQALHTEVGTAPGVSLRVGTCHFVAVPGVPREMRWHMKRHIEPLLTAQGSVPVLSRTLVFAGIGESSLAERINELELPPTVKVSYRTHLPENHVRLRSTNAQSLQEAGDQIISCAPKDFVGEADMSLEAKVLELCAKAKLTFGSAESCTGGLLGEKITRVPGASSVFSGAVVCYSNAVKTGILGVDEGTIEQHGAVSEQTAQEMAIGAVNALKCDLAVSITGIAGPGGGTPDKPVGTVCFGWSGPGLNETRRFQLRGDRERIRALSVGIALNRIRRWLDE